MHHVDFSTFCKINKLLQLYAHFTRFSCRICLIFNNFRQSNNYSRYNFVSIKRKTGGFQRCKFRFKFKCSYI